MFTRARARAALLYSTVVLSFAQGALGGGGSVARAATINFDSRKHGQIINTDYQLSKGVVISAVNFQSGPNLAITFDTRRAHTNDFDLEDPWDTGNLPGEQRMNKVLIIAENDVDADNNGLIDRPDDQGSTPALGSAGQITLAFDAPQDSFGLDLIDVESGDYQVGYIAYFLFGTEIARVGLQEFITPSSIFYDSSVAFGDNSVNRIQPMTAAELNIVAYDKIVLDMGICYAVDNLNFTLFTGTLPAVPEPAGVALLIGWVIPAMARRRRRA